MENIIWVSLWLGSLPILGLIIWWWNELWYGLSSRVWFSDLKLPPGHMGLPVVGEMHKFLWYFKILGRPDDFINSKRNKYGKAVGLYKSHLFRSPVIIATSPSFCKFVFQTETYFTRDWPTVELIGHNSLSASQGIKHRRLKAFISRGINQSDALSRIALMVQPRVISTLDSWCKRGQITVYNEADKVTFENIGKFMINIEPGVRLDTLAENFEIMMDGYRANPIKIPGTAFYHALQSRKKVVAIFRDELQKRKEINNGDAEWGVNDLLDGLMQFKDDEGKQLSDSEAIDNIINLVVAGHKSTSLAVMWAVYYLAKYPHVLMKLREEHIPLSKRKNGELITSDEVMSLKYTNKVVEEIIRLANVAMLIFRTAKKDVEYEGYMIPKGWSVVLWLRYLHTNPENFEDPMSFNPDRWNETLMPGTFVAFGGGSRMCAGNKLARLQIAIFLHYLTIGYKWELVNPNSNWSYIPYQKPNDGVEIFIERYNDA